jgi:phospholipid/cholesterol/gamma-HCH transport system ATP-binding protein
LLNADKGTVEVLGQEVSQLNIKDLNALRVRVGFAFQSSALYDSMNVKENLEFPLRMNSKTLL